MICNPFGQEALRAHRALRELAFRLSGAGFHVMRFDYSGTGDSAGDDGDLELWLEDLETAIDEIRELSGSSGVALAGLRLGAALALQAASRREDVTRLGLWDPVLDGGAYLDQLADSHAAWLRDHTPPPHAVAERPPREAHGFAVTPRLRATLEALVLEGTRVPERSPALALTSPGVPGPRLVGRVRHEPTTAAPVWVVAEDGMAHAVVPGDVLDRLAAWVVGA